MNPISSDQACILLVFEIMGVRIGMDARQIARTTDCHLPLPPATNRYYFHERVSFRERLSDYLAPVILHPAPHLALDGVIVVDQLQAMRTIDCRNIHRLPRWLASQQTPFWGVALLEDGLVLLADLTRLLPRQSHA
ncbi:MAG: hypothetical protein HQL90_08925 [Magnetococcales bacterium]|nr:hypothetical protein [Magnetococcales bacterium]